MDKILSKYISPYPYPSELQRIHLELLLLDSIPHIFRMKLAKILKIIVKSIFLLAIT